MILLFFLLPLTIASFFDDYAISKHVKNDEWKEVQSFYEDKVKDNPQDAQALFSAGVAAFKQHDLERAHALFTRAAELKDSVEEKSFFNIGNIEMINKKYQEALDAYESVLKINPDNERARERAELARQMLQQPPQDEQSDTDKKDKQDKNNQDKSEQESSNDDSNDREQDQQKNEDDSAGEDADDKSQGSERDGKQQKNQEKGQNDRRKDNKKSDHEQKQNGGQDKHEEAKSQAAEHKEEQDIQSQNEKDDHDKSNKGSKDQSTQIDPKDQWKARLFKSLDSVEENSHKDMMQVVYAAQAPQDQTPNW